MAREILLSKKTEQGLRLDPRTKLLLIFIISIFVMGGTGGEAMGLIRLVLCAVPALLLLTSKQFVKAVSYIAVFSVFYAVQVYVLPHLTGILNFLVLFTTGFFCRILPSVAIAAYAVKTTTVSELISGMERIHMPKEVTIPLTVMFRFFPTVFQESEAISDAMKMRGIKLGGKKSSKILEYKLIPMITCSVKIGEELSASAITRGLGAPVKLRAIQDSKRQLYERYALGEIDLETYRSQKAVYDAELVQAKNVHAAITAQTKQIQSDYEARLKQREIVQEVGSTDVLTQSLIDRLINRVYVFPGDRIEIEYVTQDFLGTEKSGKEA